MQHHALVTDRSGTAHWGVSYAVDHLHPDHAPTIVAQIADAAGRRIQVGMLPDQAARFAKALRTAALYTDSAFGFVQAKLLDDAAISVHAEALANGVDLTFDADGDSVAVRLNLYEPGDIANALLAQIALADDARAALRRGTLPGHRH